MSVLAIIGAFLTIVGPALTPLLVRWAEQRLTPKRTDDEIDEHIRQHYAGNPAGLINLSHQLEILQREAARKRRH